MGFIDEIKARAKADKKTIVLPETEDIRTYEAAEAVLKEGTANLILVGSEEEIAKNKGDFDISGATIVDPATSEKTEGYIAKLVELRQKKGMTEEQARELLLTNYLYYGVMMVKMKDADGMVSGAAPGQPGVRGGGRTDCGRVCFHAGPEGHRRPPGAFRGGRPGGGFEVRKPQKETNGPWPLGLQEPE